MLITTSKVLIKSLDNRSALVILTEPAQCKCGHMAAFVINRDGKTMCVECVHKEEQDAK